jgi:EAL domain-containing protein (putative c-di-GMP-specific phosphodiesterase class I)
MGLRMALDDFGTDYSVQAAADRRIEPLFKPL